MLYHLLPYHGGSLMALSTYLICLIVGSITIFALRKQEFSIPTDLESTWKHLVAGWCIGITIVFVLYQLF